MKYTLFLTICAFTFFLNVNATDYAILISPGLATGDYIDDNSEYWYDLFLAYEELVIYGGYNPANIYVFYGDGSSFYSNDTTYQLKRYKWPNIVKYNNEISTLQTEFTNIGKKVSNNDNLFIRWVVGHGTGIDTHSTEVVSDGQYTERKPKNGDDYWLKIENWHVWISESVIIDIINRIPNYKKRIILWSTCYSGCLTSGTKTLNNDKTIIITSSIYNQPCIFRKLDNFDDTRHSYFNLTIHYSITGKDFFGKYFSSDKNTDNVISIYELWNMAYAKESAAEPQLSDGGNVAKKIYLNEDLFIKDAAISSDINYLVRSFKISASTITSGADIEVDFDNSFEISEAFNASVGSTLNIHP